MDLRTTFYTVLLVLSFIGADAAEAAQNEQPNILIIMADDLTYNDLPIYGGNNVQTPNVDKLASEGMVFNNAFVTMSMCNPCRAELYTGLYPVSNGIMWNHSRARDGVKSIVQYLDDEGYRTGLAGKVHVAPTSVFPFEMVEGLERKCVSRTAKFETGGLQEFIERDSEQPFCLVSALVVPHIPWTVGDPSNFDPKELKLPPYLADTPEIRKEFAKYLAEIEVFDRQVGRALDLLEKTGEADNTIVILTSEQGGQWLFCKWTNYDAGVHTSFIVRWPGKVKEGGRTDALIQYVDVLPTLLDAVGAYDESDFDGKSFLPVLFGKKDAHREYAYFMHNNFPEGPSYPIRSVTDGTYHYVRNLNHEEIYIEKHLMARMPLNTYWPSWIFQSTTNAGTKDLVNRYMHRPSEEFYNMEADPFEMHNIASDKGKKKKLEELSYKLDQWMKSQGDPGGDVDTRKSHENAKKGDHFSISKKGD